MWTITQQVDFSAGQESSAGSDSLVLLCLDAPCSSGFRLQAPAQAQFLQSRGTVVLNGEHYVKVS